jgi:hypothetical protein
MDNVVVGFVGLGTMALRHRPLQAARDRKQ